MNEKIGVIGAGYVGLTTAICLAELGHGVVCADVDTTKVALLESGRVPIHEADLEPMLRAHLAAGRLRFVVGARAAAAGTEFIFMCLPTPSSHDGSADLTFLTSAVSEIADDLTPGSVVINKSTVPVGTARLVADAIGRPDVFVVSNPEFLREGTAVTDFLHPDRVILGSDNSAARDRVAALYRSIDAPVFLTDSVTAETIKYASNAFLATKLSFVNALASICEVVGADGVEVMTGMGLDHRIGHNFLQPGPGWGGSCFPKDTRALIHIAETVGLEFPLLRAVVEANEAHLDRVACKIERLADGELQGKRVGILGLTFKAGTDDLRDSPAIAVVTRLLAGGATVYAYDPTVTRPILDGVEVTTDPYSACDSAEVVAILTEWAEFRCLDLDKVADVMTGRAIVDARNMLDPAEVRKRNLIYEGIGRR